MRRVVTIALVGMCIPFLTGCYVFSGLQSARMAKPGQVEFTPGYSSISFAAEGESDKMTDNLGLQFGVGATRHFNIRARYERLGIAGGGGGYNFFALEPKFGSPSGIIAFSMPVGSFFGDDIESTMQFHPTLLLTAPINQTFEINGSVKVLIFAEEDTDKLVAFNFGFGIGDVEKIVIRPEIGFLINPGETGHFRAFSIGATFYSW
jgi:hypothetical protein